LPSRKLKKPPLPKQQMLLLNKQLSTPLSQHMRLRDSLMLRPLLLLKQQHRERKKLRQ